MPLDPSIPLQVKTLQLPDPLEGYTRAMTLQNLALQNQQHTRQYEQDLAMEQAFREHGGNLEAALPKLMQVNPKAGLALQSQLAAQKKAALETQKLEGDIAGQQEGGAVRVALTALLNPDDATISQIIQQYKNVPGVAQVGQQILGLPVEKRPEVLQRLIMGMKGGREALQALQPKPLVAGANIVQENPLAPNFMKSLGKVEEQPGVAESRDAVPDGKGGWMPNPIKLATQQAGASRQITNVNAFTPASEEAQKELMKATRVNFERLRDAPVQLANLEKAKALIGPSSPFVGSFGSKKREIVQFLNNNLGTSISPDAVANSGELRTRVFQNIMDNLKKMDAQPSQLQQQIMMEALGNLNEDPRALGKMLDAYADVIRGKVEQHNSEVAGAVKNQVKFPYDPTIKLPDAGATEFRTVSEAAKAAREGKLKPGTRVVIGGRPGTWQ